MCIDAASGARYLLFRCTCRCTSCSLSTPRTRGVRARRLAAEHLPILGVVMRVPVPARGPTVAPRAGVPPSPGWPRLFYPACWVLTDGPAPTPVVPGLTGPSDRQLGPGMQARDKRTADGLGGGDTRGWEASAAPPPTFVPVGPVSAATANSCGHPERVEGEYGARFPALIATLASLERKSVLLRIVGAVSIPHIEAVLGLTPPATRPAAQQTLSALPPSATAPDPPPRTRVPVVLLPHARTEPTDTRPTTHRAGRVTGMNHDQSPRHHPARSDTTTLAIAARQWHDTELAIKVARHSFDRWLTASDQGTPSLTSIHAHPTRTAVHEAARTIATLINTLDAEATQTDHHPARDTDILPPLRPAFDPGRGVYRPWWARSARQTHPSPRTRPPLPARREGT
jgi:hypothetical protein